MTKIIIITATFLLSISCARKSIPKQADFNETVVSKPRKSLDLSNQSEDMNVFTKRYLWIKST